MQNLSLLLLFCSLSAFAQHEVGTVATFNLKNADGAKYYDAKIVEYTPDVILKLSATAYYEDGSEYGFAYAFNSKDLAEIKAAIADCEGSGGVPEKITVPAGEFDTCKIVDGSSTNWISDAAPDYFVKFVDSSDGYEEELAAITLPAN